MSSSIQFQSLNVDDDDAFRLTILPSSSGNGWKSTWRRGSDTSYFSLKCCAAATVIVTALLTFTLSVAALYVARSTSARVDELTAMQIRPIPGLPPPPPSQPPPSPPLSPPPSPQPPSPPVPPSFRPLQRIAFGSCTAHDLRPQPIWNQVVAAKPDAWIWLGDLAYVDNPLVDCSQVPNSPQCNCTPSWLKSPPDQCFVADADHIRERFEYQVNLPEYRAFLEYMCPGSAASAQFPPPGSDPAACPRPVLGTYDDHDSGWNNGNKRIPGKHVIKNMYLDALGEPEGSPRRTSLGGLQASYTLSGPPRSAAPAGSDTGGSSSGGAGSRDGSSGGGSGDGGGGPSGGSGSGNATSRDVQVILLDERYYRDTVPCQMRRGWCEGILSTPPPAQPRSDLASAAAWCQDFLKQDDGWLLEGGSCCPRDEQLAAWCNQTGSTNDPLWSAACDPTSPQYGMTPLAVLPNGTGIKKITPSMYDSQQAELWPWLVHGSPTCEVLGVPQRQWLQQQLSSSDAALHIVASGSVLLGGVGSVGPQGPCSGDDWECWKPAQINLLHTLASASVKGCVLVLVGDFHYADIKLVMPGANTSYSQSLRSNSLAKPLWQFMSSGMTNSTARHANTTCSGSFLEDLVGLRPLGTCSYYPYENFGTVDIDWDARTVTLQVHDGNTGAVAADAAGTLQQVTFSLDTCLPTA